MLIVTTLPHRAQPLHPRQIHATTSCRILQANDPDGNVIFSKLEQNDAELAFKTRAAGRHAFCLSLARASAGRASRAARLVQLDILVGTVYEHDKITEEHLDDMMADISALSGRVQKLLSEVHPARPGIMYSILCCIAHIVVRGLVAAGISSAPMRMPAGASCHRKRPLPDA